MCSSGNSSTAEPHRFSVFIPTLEKLASQKMSLVVYRQEFHPGRCYNIDDRSDWSIDPYFDPKNYIDGLPSAISKMIKECLEKLVNKVDTSITNWCLYHDSHVFFDCSLDEGMKNCIDEFVLELDGGINFRSTAKNVIKEEKLNFVEMYRLACLYCLEDDVRRIWPTVQDNPRITELNPVNYPVIHFWNCVMKGESPRFPGTDPDSLEECLVILANMKWQSIEYFWNVLSADEQVTSARRLLMGNDEDMVDTDFIKPLLLRLDETQLRRIMREIPAFLDRLLDAYFMYHSDSGYEEILSIWIYLRHFISPLEFLQIIKFFIGWFRFKRECGALLFEIWTSASDELKSSFLNNVEALKTSFWKLPFSIRIEPCYFDVRFFIEVLKSTRLDFQSKKDLWFEIWSNFITYSSPEQFYLMMKACFRQEDEIIEFKERYLMNFDKISGFCNLCFRSGRIWRLNDFLNFSSSNTLRVKTLKQQIIRSENVLRNFWFNSLADGFQKAVDDLEKFIDSASFSDEEAAYHKKNYSNSRIRSRSVFVGLSMESEESEDDEYWFDYD